jgi:adenosine kinase
MNVVVIGSIAVDHLMVFPGRFAEQLLDGRLEDISLSFLVDDLEIRRGGVGANIALGLARLGQDALLVGAVGADFADYRAWLESHGVDTSGVRVSRARHTARFQCTTDSAQKQIASFYAGAMSEMREIDLLGILDGRPSVDLVLISANDPAGMLRHTAECRERGVPFAADVSQQLAAMDGDGIRELVDGATYLFTNAYERSLLERKTGWSGDEVLARVGTAVTTQGARGVLVERRGERALHVPAGVPRTVVEPTGVGDGFRAGFLAGLGCGLATEQAARLGCVVAGLVLETVGPQDYPLDHADVHARLAEAYGAEAAAEIGPRLRIRAGRHTATAP